MIYFYDLIIKPIELLLEIVYSVMYAFLENAGAAIISVSVAVSLLTLPIYKKAEKLQEEEIKKQKELKYGVNIIKKAFVGEEKLMMLSAYYKENDYHPASSLKSILPLLLQIPFFLAAYHFLSNLRLLQGLSFCIISDLGQPDEIIKVGTIQLHMLPILMTFLNAVSGYIYTRGKGIREKLQVYLPAILFLFLLYECPSGLVLYWTTNNLFSLLKNLITKCCYKYPKIEYYLVFVSAVLFAVFYLFSEQLKNALKQRDREEILIILLGIVLLFFISIWGIRSKNKDIQMTYEKRPFPVQAIIVLTIFLGFFIPLTVVSSSPQEFVNVFRYRSPLRYIVTTFLMTSGFLVIWGYVLYTILPHKWKSVFEYVLYGIIPVTIYNFCFVNADMGTCDTRLRFEKEIHLNSWFRYGNLLINIIIFLVCILIYYRKRVVIKFLLNGVMLSFFIIIGINLKKSIDELNRIHMGEEHVEFTLSRTEKNVVVIMLDRAIGAYVPYILEEKPELKERMDGFTFYPNTVSTAYATRWGSQGIFGGYDYIGENMLIVDSNEEWEELTNEALTMMPKIFEIENYQVTVSDVPYAGGQNFPDLSIYGDMNHVNAFHYGGRFKEAENFRWEEEWETIERNFMMYSLLRISPAEMQDNIYDGGRYLYPEKYSEIQYGQFEEEYRALSNLSEYTVISEDRPCLIMYANYMTHEPNWLQLPNYELTDTIDNSKYEFRTVRELNGIKMDLDKDGDQVADTGKKEYFVNIAAYLCLADWFDYLRENGVYDNTRIILTSDHGYTLGQFEDFEILNGGDAQSFNCLLMVKDFNSSGFTIDNSFMTNADVPAIAMDGIVMDPVNPYTGHPITMEGKEGGVDIMSFEGAGRESIFYHVKEDIYQKENWSYTGIKYITD